MTGNCAEFSVRCNLGEWGFMARVTSSYTLSMLFEEIYLRHEVSVDDNMRLVYSTPGCKECYLSNEHDWAMLFYAVKRYDLDVVEIKILRGPCPVEVSLNDGSSGVVVDEDELLGAPFRSNPEPKFLSDEWAFYIVGVGQKFIGGVAEFREKIRKYAIQVGFRFFFEKNDSRYVSLVCEDVECSFFIKASLCSSDNFFYIRKCELSHTCSSVRRDKKHVLIDSDLVSSCMHSDVLFNSAIRPNDIVNKFKVYYGFEITYKIALNARCKALENIYGSEEDSFNKLVWYRKAVLESNPGSIFELEVDPNTNRFVRLFVAYGGCVEGFKHCIPVLYLDGCFGKSSYKGQVIGATSKNGNKGIYPVAVCVCDSESEDNWLFFFNHLKKVTDLHPRPVTFISDRGVGLLIAFDLIFPDSPHLFCYDHLRKNLRARYLGKGSSVKADAVEKQFFKCAYSSSESEYYFNLNILRIVGGATVIDSFLKGLALSNWCRAFGVGTRFGIMANSTAESFNKWINLERSMPVYTMLEEIRIKQMEMISDRRLEASKWTSILTPKMEAKLISETDKGRKFKVINSHDGVYEVRDIFSYMVDLNERNCSCKKWQINAFPCPHALAALSSAPNSNVFQCVDSVFYASTFRQCYDCPIIPISNVDEQFIPSTQPHIKPPVVKRQPGRRRKIRFKSRYETKEPRKKTMCGRCKKMGDHNRLTCKEVLDG